MGPRDFAPGGDPKGSGRRTARPHGGSGRGATGVWRGATSVARGTLGAAGVMGAEVGIPKGKLAPTTSAGFIKENNSTGNFMYIKKSIGIGLAEQ